MTRYARWITGLGAAVLSGSLAFAAVPGRPTQAHPARPHQEDLIQQLKLTDQQKQQWVDARQAAFKKNQGFYGQARQTAEQYRAAKKAGDAARANALKEKMEAQREQMNSLKANEEALLMSVLDQQQKVQYRRILADRDAQQQAERAAREKERQERLAAKQQRAQERAKQATSKPEPSVGYRHHEAKQPR